MKKELIILAIETSCDDTCISIIKASGKTNPHFDILSNIVSSQTEIHKKWGGVYPTLAKREHQRNLIPVLKKALREANLLKKSKCQSSNVKSNPKLKAQKLKKILKREEILYKQLREFLEKYQKPDIDLIAVTNGPGLEPCLWVGLNFAKVLSFWWNIPIVPVNHIEAHILANFISNVKCQMSNVKCLFPAICLVVSGGHTQLILMKNIGEYKILGETRDDAAGECFDKTARILGLPYPGGPAISAEATKIQKSNIQNLISNIQLPRPMINQKNYDFSFSGLKTAVLYKIKDSRFKIKDKNYIRAMCAEVQQAIIDVLIKKTIKAAKDYKAKTLILGGGVAANDELRKQFREACLKCKFKHLIPPKNLCTDNAVMVGIACYFHHKKKIKNPEKIKAEANLRLG